MGFISKMITGAVVGIGSELLLKRVLPAALQKGRKIVRDLEREEAEKEAAQQKKGE